MATRPLRPEVCAAAARFSTAAAIAAKQQVSIPTTADGALCRVDDFLPAVDA
jgi:hypothetical protein